MVLSNFYEVSFLMKFHLHLNLNIYEYVQIGYDLNNLSVETLRYGTPYWWGCGTIFETAVMSPFNRSLKVIMFVLLSSNFMLLFLAIAGPYLQQILFCCRVGGARNSTRLEYPDEEV